MSTLERNIVVFVALPFRGKYCIFKCVLYCIYLHYIYLTTDLTFLYTKRLKNTFKIYVFQNIQLSKLTEVVLYGRSTFWVLGDFHFLILLTLLHLLC